jgi:histidine triad (HIT) family protein
MASIFTKIINGEIPAYKVAEDENFIAILDINPLVKGHTLVIPKIENDFIFDLNDQTLTGLIIFAKKVAKAIDKAIPCKRVGVLVIGTEVRHTHIHLIPFNNETEMNIHNPKLKLSKDEFEEITAKIKKEL